MKYDGRDITAYLLGSTTEEETERFDELSITDDEFAEALDEAEKELVDAYVGGELAGTERTTFEQRYLDSALGRSKIHFAGAFREYGARHLPIDETRTEEADDRQKASGFFGFAERYFQWGLAAAIVLLAAVGGWLLIDGSRLRDEIGKTAALPEDVQKTGNVPGKETDVQPPTSASEAEMELARLGTERTRLERESERERERSRNAIIAEQSRQSKTKRSRAPSVLSFVLAPQLRSAGQLQSLKIPLDTDRVAIQLGLEPNDFSSYRVALREQSTNRVVWQSGTLRAAHAGDRAAINVSVPTRFLKAQIYNFSVFGIRTEASPEIIGDYAFRVVR